MTCRATGPNFPVPRALIFRTSDTRYEPSVAFYFCTDCGCVTHYRALKPDSEGRIRTAVNLRMAEPDVVAHLPIRHWEGLQTFASLGQDGRCVTDMWF